MKENFSITQSFQACLIVVGQTWLRVPPEIVVWTYDIFDNKFEIENDV